MFKIHKVSILTHYSGKHYTVLAFTASSYRSVEQMKCFPVAIASGKTPTSAAAAAFAGQFDLRRVHRFSDEVIELPRRGPRWTTLISRTTRPPGGG